MDRPGPASGLIHIDPASVELDPSGADLEPLGRLGEEPSQDGGGFPAEDPVVAPSEPGVGEAGSPARKDPLVRCLNVRVGAHYEAHLSIEMPP